MCRWPRASRAFRKTLLFAVNVLSVPRWSRGGTLAVPDLVQTGISQICNLQYRVAITFANTPEKALACAALPLGWRETEEAAR